MGSAKACYGPEGRLFGLVEESTASFSGEKSIVTKLSQLISI
jgi:hypothetical protein